MSEPCCAFIKPDGQPCAARPLPGRPFCLFHDPNEAGRLAEARSKGGAAPRRRLRRYPRLLDHFQVAELLGELFIDAINHTDPADTKRLQVLTHLSRALLQAVGTPNATYLEHASHAEPAPAADHLLRVYPAPSAEVEALLDEEQRALTGTALVEPATPFPDHPGSPVPIPPLAARASEPPENLPAGEPTALGALASPPLQPHGPGLPYSIYGSIQPQLPSTAARPALEDVPSEPAEPCPPLPATAPYALEQKMAAQDREQDEEQVPDRTGTGPAGTIDFSPGFPPAENPPPSPEAPRAQPRPCPPMSTPAVPPESGEPAGISSLRRVTIHPTSAAGWASPYPGWVARDAWKTSVSPSRSGPQCHPKAP